MDQRPAWQMEHGLAPGSRFRRLAVPDITRQSQIPQGAIAYLKRLYYDTALSASPYALSSLRELVDPSRVLFGSDYPFASEFIVDIMVKGLQSFDGFGAEELAAIERGNAARMFPKCNR